MSARNAIEAVSLKERAEDSEGQRAGTSGHPKAAAAPAAPHHSAHLPRPKATPPARMARKLGAFVQAWGVQVASLATAVVLWYWAVETDFNFIVNFDNVPSPVKVWTAFVGHLGDMEFYWHLLTSLERMAFAYGFAALLGIPLGLAMGRSRVVRRIVIPYVEIMRPIPAVAWIPLAILMWPTEESSIIYITFLGAFFPIILNTMHGVEQTPEVLTLAARSLGAKRAQIFIHVAFPAALPSIVTGLAVGMGVAWFSLLAGEIISGQYGIGYFTWNAYSLIRYPDIVVGMLCIGLMGTISTYGVQLLTSPLLRWQKKTR